jgi:hypothetical protein
MPAVKFFVCLDLERKSLFFKAPINSFFGYRETGRYVPGWKGFRLFWSVAGKRLFVRDGVEKCQFMSMNVRVVARCLRCSNAWRMHR